MKFLTLSLALGPCAVSAIASLPPTATIDTGPLVGVTTNLPGALGPVNKFLGVPYAAPPERFSLPRRPTPWTSARNATAFQASCIQYMVDADVGPGRDVIDGLFNTHPRESEDCLYMNAFTPATQGPPEGRAVVVFIPGGGWQLGNGLLDLSGFAGYEDIVAFTFNYRTNIFGFPNAAEIGLSQRNLGLHDQRRALAWVQANARAFGGDPKKVTIWGESAGAMSVDLHMQGYAQARPPPFRAGIMSSGQMSFGLLSITNSPRDTRSWDNLAGEVGCRGNSSLACMRRVPAKQLVEGMAKANMTALPIADNLTVPANRAAAWRDGRVAKVPVLMSTMAQEGRALVNRNITMQQFVGTYLPETLVTPKQRDAIVSLYRSKPGLESDFDVAAAIYTDLLWQCPQQNLANVSASTGLAVWRSYINASIAELLPEQFQFLGKFHGGDVVLLFSTPTFEGGGGGDGFKLTPQLYAFANYFRGVIGTFVRNPHGGPGWPAVGSSYAPFDVVALGDVGEQRSAGATPVNQTTLDADCAVFSDIYPLVEKFLSVS
ncbi:carboxylesterase family protein [Hirsutella rhossiliensis]|uniref:Carboxylic ester hydrolase n=1 Tax=Hirsutella rhossiliensis TaxID=111463 RepID=A0A9P8N6G0_9HYPO|nr:carboxylesterase family domain-containing protein [Hirsutella rhossiliensis]KAH0967847.1 carboxylesterase family domain-containing protein [Hirsutella rhossiliensis]